MVIMILFHCFPNQTKIYFDFLCSSYVAFFYQMLYIQYIFLSYIGKLQKNIASFMLNTLYQRVKVFRKKQQKRLKYISLWKNRFRIHYFRWIFRSHVIQPIHSWVPRTFDLNLVFSTRKNSLCIIEQFSM